MSRKENLEELLKGYLDQSETLIPWETLDIYNFFEWFEFGPGITGMKVFENDRRAIFLTKIEKGKGFGPHSHNMVEHIFVVDGFLHELTTKEKATTGGRIRYGEFVRHEPVSPIEDTLIVVVFENPSNGVDQ